jgi:hypothetical protein
MKLTIKFLELDSINKKGRIYNKEAGEIMVKTCNKRIKKFGAVYGELEPDFIDGISDSLSRASHIITDIRIEDNRYLVADIFVINTHSGKIAKEIMNNLTLSPRSTGFVGEDNVVEISDFFTLDLIPKEESSYDL